MSWGGLGPSNFSFTLDAALQYANSKGVVLVAAAGNDQADITSNPEYPANYPNVIAVGATGNPLDTNLLHRWHQGPGNGSNYTTGTGTGRVDVYAPGYQLESTCLSGYPLFGVGCVAGSPATTGFYGPLTGTSQASAIVSGAAALIIGAKVATIPAQVKEALTCGTVPMQDFGGDPAFPYSAGELELDYTLNWQNNSNNCKITLVNDDIRSAVTIASAPFNSSMGLDTRTATPAINDPLSNCSTPVQQSLWYKFKPVTNGSYQFATFGSSYNTSITVYKGDPGSLVEVACNDDYGPYSQSDLTVDLIAAQTYYIMISTNDAVSDFPQILNFTMRAVIMATTKTENTATQMLYTGTWGSVTATGQSGTVSRTTDDTAILAFSVRSTNIIIARTTGPGKDDMDVYVDGNPAPNSPALNYTATTKYQNQFLVYPTDQTMALRRVVIVRHTGSAGMPIDIDWVQGTNATAYTKMTAITGQVDDRDVRIIYSPGTCTTTCNPDQWQQTTLGAGSGAYKDTLVTATDPTAHLDFRFTGTSVIIYRSTGPSFTIMSVFVDGKLFENVHNDGTAADTRYVPYVITGLSMSDHVITISPVAPTGGTLSFDSVKVVTAADIPASVKTNENSPNLLYTGVWTPHTGITPGLGAYLNTDMQTTDPNATVRFSFTGTQLIVGYGSQLSNAATLEIYVDGVLKNSVDTTEHADLGDPPVRYTHGIPCDPPSGCNFISTTVLTYAKHSVIIKNNNGGGNTTGIILDYVQGLNFPTIKSAGGIVAETSTSFLYSGTVGTNCLVSTWCSYTYPGNHFVGLSAKSTLNNNATIDFYFNGSGFLIYGDQGQSPGPIQDRGYWEIWVDNPGASINPLDTSMFTEDWPHPTHRAFALGVVSGTNGAITVNIGPGVHWVRLKAHLGTGERMTFDGIRVFP
jgi:hypothetical protein